MSNLHKSVRNVIMFAALVTNVSTSGPARAASSNPILVELFTSESCSDCPPADTFLRTLDITQPVAGAQLIVLEEHVDYWDDQGWRDPFSSHELTLRQSEYVQRLRLSSPFTPQMIVDGNDSLVGSDRVKAARIFAKAAGAPKVNIEISSLRIENGKLVAKIATQAVPSKAEVFVALALDHAQSQVLHGENGGRHLEHVAIVKRLASIGKAKQGESFTKEVSLPMDQPPQGYRVIAFVQEPDQGRILGAALARLQ